MHTKAAPTPPVNGPAFPNATSPAGNRNPREQAKPFFFFLDVARVMTLKTQLYRRIN
jgi:hypothetical protein